MTAYGSLRPLSSGDALRLAEALGDSPETAIDVHQLLRGLCRAFVVGNPARFRASLIQGDPCPDEPAVYGTDPDAAWSLLRRLEGWACVNVPMELGRPLAGLIEKGKGVPVRRLEDVYHVLEKPPVSVAHEAVRRFKRSDIEVLGSAEKELRGFGFETEEALLAEGAVAGAVIEGRIVSMAHTYALSPGYADIGAATLEAHRGRGLATAAGAVVASAVREGGRIPVWSTGENNHASLRVAEKLGFRECGRRVYLIPESL